MPRYFARSNGAFNDAARWSLTPTGAGGAGIPTVGDEAVANSFTVTISADVTCDFIRNDTVSGLLSGGTFILTDLVTLNANITGGGPRFTRALTYTGSLSAAINGIIFGTSSGDSVCVQHDSNGILNIVGTVSGQGGGININTNGTVNVLGEVIGGTTGGYGILTSPNGRFGTINVMGNVRAGPGVNAPGIRNDFGILNVQGNVIGGTGHSGSQGINVGTGITNIVGDIFGGGSAQGVNNAGTTTVNITGNCLGGTQPAVQQGGAAPGVINIFGNVIGGANGAGALNTGSGIINVYGNAIGGVGNLAYGASNTSIGTINVYGTATGNGWGLGSTGIAGPSPGIFGSSFGITQVQSLSSGSRGQWPTAGHVFVMPISSSTFVMETSAFTDVSFFTSLSANTVPAPADVRSGVSYSFGERTGFCNMPGVSSVLQGVDVDNSTGVATLQSQLIWNHALSATINNTLGNRLQHVLTQQTMNAVASAFGA